MFPAAAGLRANGTPAARVNVISKMCNTRFLEDKPEKSSVPARSVTSVEFANYTREARSRVPGVYFDRGHDRRADYAKR